MNQITINDEQRLQLNGFEQTQEVRDQSGELLGFMVSPSKYARLVKTWEEWEEADLAELDRIARDEPVCTLDEIWKELGA